MTLRNLIIELNNANQQKSQTLEIVYTKETLNFITLLVEEGYLLQYVLVDNSVSLDPVLTPDGFTRIIFNPNEKAKIVIYLKYDCFGNSAFNKIVFLPNYHYKIGNIGAMTLGLTHALIIKYGDYFYLLPAGTDQSKLECQGVIVAKIL